MVHEKNFFVIHEKTSAEIALGGEVRRLQRETAHLQRRQAQTQREMHKMEERVRALEEGARRAEQREEEMRGTLAECQSTCRALQAALAATQLPPQSELSRPQPLTGRPPSLPNEGEYAVTYHQSEAEGTAGAQSAGVTQEGTSVAPTTPATVDFCTESGGTARLAASCAALLTENTAALLTEDTAAQLTADTAAPGGRLEPDAADDPGDVVSPEAGGVPQSPETNEKGDAGDTAPEESQLHLNGETRPLDGQPDSEGNAERCSEPAGSDLHAATDKTEAAAGDDNGASDNGGAVQSSAGPVEEVTQERGTRPETQRTEGTPEVSLADCSPAHAEQMLRERVFNPSAARNRNGTPAPRIALEERGDGRRIALSVSVGGEEQGWALVDYLGDQDWSVKLVGAVPNFRLPPGLLLQTLVQGIIDRCGSAAWYTGARFQALTQPRECPEMAHYFRTMVPGGCRNLGDNCIFVEFTERDLQQGLCMFKAGRTLAAKGSGSGAARGTPFEQAAHRAKRGWAHFPLRVQGELYGLYKQATAGDAPDPTGDVPLQRRAWLQQRGKPRDKATQEYIMLVDEHLAGIPPEPAPADCSHMELPVRIPDRRGVTLLFEPADPDPGVTYTPEGSTERRPASRVVKWDPAADVLRLADTERDVLFVQDPGVPERIGRLRALFDAAGVEHDLPPGGAP